MDERLARTVEALHEIGADWAILSNADSIAYALGYAPPIESGPSAFAAGPNVAVIGRDGSAGMLALKGEASSPREGVVLRYDGYGQLPASPPDAHYCETFKNLVQALGVDGSIATEPATLPAIIDAVLPSNKKNGLAQALRRQRMTKTADEVDALRRSAEVAAAGQRRLVERVRPGISELQLFCEVRAAMETTANERIAVAGDFLSGRERTAAVWGWPSARVLQTGDAVLADLAPRVGAYWGDSCSTVVLGSPSDGQMKLFNAVREALELAVAEIRPGMSAAAAHRMIQGAIRRAGFDYT